MTSQLLTQPLVTHTQQMAAKSTAFQTQSSKRWMSCEQPPVNSQRYDEHTMQFT